MNKKHLFPSVLSTTRLLLVLLLSLLLTLPVLAEDDPLLQGEEALNLLAAPEEEEPSMGEGEVIVEIAVPEEETITVETGEVEELDGQSAQDTESELQTLVNEAVDEALTYGEMEVEIELTEESYEIGTLLLDSCEGDIETITLVGREDGGTRIDGNIKVTDVIVELINIILGGDKILQVENTEDGNGDAAVIGGTVAEGERLDVLISIPDDAEAEDYAESAVELEASPGAQIVADLRAGHLSVITDREDEDEQSSVTVTKKNAVSFRYRSGYAPTVSVESKSEGSGTVNLLETVAESARFVVEAAVINVREAMSVQDIKLIAASETRNLLDLAPDFLDEVPALGDYTENLGVKNIVDNAVVNILADISAKENITVYSYITQEGGLLGNQELVGINVKVGNAEVNVARGVKLHSGGDVTLRSTVRADSGYDEFGRAITTMLPLSLNVFADRSAVTLEDGVEITAGGNITLDAMSSIKANSASLMGMAPVALAVNVIINESETAVGKGVRLTADGDIQILSSANTDAAASAKRSPTETGLNGVYLALNVIDQSSDAAVTDGAMISAGGNVAISSNSNVNATDDAIASATSSAEEGATSRSVKEMLKGVCENVIELSFDQFLRSPLYESVKSSLSEFFSFVSTRLGKLTKLLGSSGYTVELDSNAQEKGSVKVEATEEAVKVKIDTDYEVKEVLVRYLLTPESGAAPDTLYSFAKASYDKTSGSYVLKLSDVNTGGKFVNLPEFKVYVFYGDMKSEVELHDIQDDDDDSASVLDILDSGLSAAADENDADEDCAGSIQLDYLYTLNDEKKDDVGCVLTDVMAAAVTAGIRSLSALTGVEAGKNVRLNVNPAKGYKLNELSFMYTDSNGEPKLVTIEANAAGHYILQVPEDVQGEITVCADFTESDEKPESNKPSKNQFSGSLGVGVIINKNNAVIDVGEGYVSAGGKLDLTATAATNMANTANGSAVGEDDLKKSNLIILKPTEESMAATDFECEDGGEKLYVIGTMEDDAECGITRSGSVYTIRLNAATSLGYSLPESITLSVITEDNRVHKISVSGENGVYVLDLRKVDFGSNSVSESEQNTPVIRSLRFDAKIALKTYKLLTEVQSVINPDTKKSETNGKIFVDRSAVSGGEILSISAAPKDGYEPTDIVLRYNVQDGEDIRQEVIFAVRNTDGTFGLVIPDAAELAKAIDGEIKLYANFTKRANADTLHEVKLDAKTSGVLNSVEATKDGQTIKLSLNDTLKKTHRLNVENVVVTVTTAEGEKTLKLSADTLSVDIPVGIEGDIRISAKDGSELTTEMKVEVKVAEGITKGKLTPQSSTTAGGSVLLVKVEPDKEHILKAGTLKASYEGGVTVNLGKGRKLDTNLYAFDVPESVGNSGGIVTVTAEFEKGEEASSSLGIGTAVGVVVHRNNAYIRSGTVSAGTALTISAETSGKAETSALSGYNATAKAIAGAVAVEVAGYKTNAVLYRDVSFHATDLLVNGKSSISSLKTSADASCKKVATAEGFGTGVAVAVNGVDTYATVEDGVIDASGNALKSIEVSAENSIASDSVISKAGAKTAKKSTSPVVALDIAGSSAVSYLGKAVTAEKITRDYSAAEVAVKAANSAAHSMELDAGATADKAKGTVSLMAGAFGISILNDVAEAILNAGVLAQDAVVTVDARSVSTLSASVKASASGAGDGKKDSKTGKGSADTKADALVKSGEKLAANTGTKSASPEAVQTLSKDRQTAQTSEGSIAGAAAFALNIQNNTSRAVIQDGVNIQGTIGTSAKSVSVQSHAQSVSEIKADASGVLKKVKTEGDDVGVGVAVSINIVKGENSAVLGQGTTRAAEVLVEAGLCKDADGAELSNSVKTESISGAGATGTSVAGSLALSVLQNSVEARIEKAENDIYIAESTTVTASDARSGETTATASATASGAPDKNPSAGDANKAADADKGASVGIGASFAMIYGDNDVRATIILPRNNAKLGDLTLSAVSDHSEESTSVAGKDPLKELTGSTSLKGKTSQLAVDASVAINLIDTVVEAVVRGTDQYTPNASAKTIRISAREKGKSATHASGYAMGDETAVGAAVAINLNSSGVESRSECVLKVSGGDDEADEDPDPQKSVEIYAGGEITEENMAYATAIGSDVTRYFEKYKAVLQELGYKVEELDRMLKDAANNLDTLAQLMQDFLDGTLFDRIVKNLESAAISTAKNQISSRITAALNGKKSSEPNSASASSVLPVSTNILRVFGAGTGSGKDLDAQTNKATLTNNAFSGDKGKTANNAALNKDAESFQLAAAVAVSVSDHSIVAENTRSITTAGGADITAESRNDAIAHATGAAVSTAGGTGSIAMAVAVKVDFNETIARAGADLIVGQGKDITISADAQENTAETYADKLSVQAVAGAVSGSATLAISGAVAVFISNASTIAELCDNAKAMAADDQSAGNVDIIATETIRQSMRTLAAAASSANLTLGASVGVFVSNNTLRARAGSNTKIKAKNIRVKAERRSVTGEADGGETEVETEEGDAGDYGTEKESESVKEKVQTGAAVKGFVNDSELLTIKTEKATTTTAESVKVSLNTDMFTEKLETALNSLNTVDYYIAVDSGAIGVSGKKASGLGSIAGSIATVVLNNTVESIIASNAVLESGEDMEIKAESAEQSRFISGAVSANANAKAKLAVGAVIGFVKESNNVSAIVEDGAQLLCGRDLTMLALHDGSTELYTVTAAVSASAAAEVGVAATINVLLSDATAEVKLGQGAAHSVGQKAAISAMNTKNLTLVTLTPAVGDAKVQVGGAVAVILEESKAGADLRGVKLSVGGENNATAGEVLTISADNTHDMTLATASASVGSSTAAVAGVISVLVDDSGAEALVKDSTITSAVTANGSAERYKGGDVTIRAKNDSTILQANVQAVVGSSGVSVGGSVLTSVLQRSVVVDAENAVLTVANGDLTLHAEGEDTQVIIAAGAGFTTGIGVQGNVAVSVENNEVLLKGSGLRATTLRGNESVDRNNMSISATYTSHVYGVVGDVNVALGSAAAGAAVVVLVNDSTTEVDLSGGELHSAAAVNTTANADNTLLLVAVGVGVSGGVDVQASLVTAVTSDTIRVKLGTASLYASALNINALGTSTENLVAGAASVAAGVSVGPALVVFVKERTVEILSEAGGTMGSLSESCPIAANALADDNTSALVIAAGGGSVAVQAGVVVEVVKNTVLCDFKAEAFAGRQNLQFSADSDTDLSAYTFGGGFGATAAVVPVITVVYQQSETLCELSGDTHGYHLDVTADSELNMEVVEAGASAAGAAGISGSFAVTVNDAVTKAIFSGSHFGDEQYSNVNVLANDSFTFHSTMITLAGGGAAGVGVTAAVNVMNNTVHAAIDPKALGDVNAERSSIIARNVKVAAESLRNVESIIDTVGIGATAGVAVNVAVLTAGSKLPQDAYDSLVYGNGKENAKTFDAALLLKSIAESNPYLTEHHLLDDLTLEKDLVGNGQYDSDTQVGDKNGVNTDGIVPEGFTSDTDDFTGSNEKSIREKDTLRGENDDVAPGKDSDLSKSGKFSEEINYIYDNAFENMIEAWVDSSVVISDTLDILARDTQNVNMDALSLAVGALGGGGAGVSVLALHSNVLATLGENAEAQIRTLQVNARSESGEDDIALRGGVFGAGALGSGAVAVAVAHLDSVTAARIDGKVSRNSDFRGSSSATVLSSSDYGDVSAVTEALSLSGFVAVGASTAVVTLNGTVASALRGSVSDLDELNLLTNVNNSIYSNAATLGGGLISVNAAVAVSSETMTVRAAVEESASVSSLRELRVMNVGSYDASTHRSESGTIKAEAETTNVSIGGSIYHASAAVSILNSDITALIAGTVKDGNMIIRVENDLGTESRAGALSTALGLDTAGGNMVLSYNNSKARALVNGEVEALSLLIASDLSANAFASMDEPSASVQEMGVSVAYAEVYAQNIASLEGSRTVKLQNLTILSGGIESTDKAGGDFYAEAELYSAGIAGGSDRINLALAVNKAVNVAALEHDGTVITDTLTAKAFGNPSADSYARSVHGNVLASEGSVALSTLDFTQLVAINCADLRANNGYTDVTAVSDLYAAPAAGALTRDSAQAHAFVEISSAALAKLNAYVAYAKNSTDSLITVNLARPIGSLVTENLGGANALSEIENASYAGVAAGAVVSLSYVQANFLNSVTVGGIMGDTVNMNTRVTSDAVAKAESNQAGVDLAELSADVVIAKSTTEAKTLLQGTSPASELHAGSISVSSDVESHTQAELKKPDTYLSVVSLGGNVVESILSTVSSAEMGRFTLVGSPTLTLNSLLNADPNRRVDEDADALARFLSSTGGTSVNGVAVKVNVMLAKNYSQNEAYLHDISGGSAVNTYVEARSHATALSDGGSKAGADGFSVAAFAAGAIVARSSNESSNIATVSAYTADSALLSILANMTAANARSVGGVSSRGHVSGVTVQVNYSEALNQAVNNAILSASGSSAAPVRVENLTVSGSAENVFASAYVGTAQLSVDAIGSYSSVADAENLFTAQTLVENSFLSGNGSMKVSAEENRAYYREGAQYVTEASVGASGSESRNIALISGVANSATALSDATVRANISGSDLHGYALELSANGRSDALARALTGTKVALLGVAVIETYADADGRVEAGFTPTANGSDLRSLALRANGAARSHATTSSAGSNVSLISSTENRAEADSALEILARLSGGRLTISGNAEVESIGTVQVDAEALTPSFSLNVGQVGVDRAEADSHLSLNTTVDTRTLSVNGTLTVRSRIPTNEIREEVPGLTPIYYDESHTNAKVQPSAGAKSESVNISLLRDTAHTALANSEHTIELNLGSSESSITAGRLLAEAVGNSATNAASDCSGTVVGLLTLGNLDSRATSSDSTKLLLSGSISARSGMQLESRNDSAAVSAEGMAPGKLTVLDGSSSHARAEIEENVAGIGVKPNSTLNVSNGDLDMLAYNAGSGTSLMHSGTTYSLGGISNSTVPVVEKFITYIDFGDASSVRAAGDVNLATGSAAAAESSVDQSVSRLAFNIDTMYGSSTVNDESRITLGSGSIVRSDSGDVALTLLQAGDVFARTSYAAGFGLFGSGTVKAISSYTGTNAVTLASNAALQAPNGALRVTQDSSNVELTAIGDSVSSDLVGSQYVDSTATLTTDHSLTLGENAALLSGGELRASQSSGSSGSSAEARLDLDSGFGFDGGRANAECILNATSAMDFTGGSVTAEALALAQELSRVALSSNADVSLSEVGIFDIDTLSTTELHVNDSVKLSRAQLNNGGSYTASADGEGSVSVIGNVHTHTLSGNTGDEELTLHLSMNVNTEGLDANGISGSYLKLRSAKVNLSGNADDEEYIASYTPASLPFTEPSEDRPDRPDTPDTPEDDKPVLALSTPVTSEIVTELLERMGELMSRAPEKSLSETFDEILSSGLAEELLPEGLAVAYVRELSARWVAELLENGDMQLLRISAPNIMVRLDNDAIVLKLISVEEKDGVRTCHFSGEGKEGRVDYDLVLNFNNDSVDFYRVKDGEHIPVSVILSMNGESKSLMLFDETEISRGIWIVLRDDDLVKRADILRK